MRICIAGGDMRMLTVAELFKGKGFECTLFGFERNICHKAGLEFSEDIGASVESSEVVLMPFPCLKNGFLNTPYSGRRTEIDSILCFNDGKKLFLGGRLPKTEKNVIDYSTHEDFLWYNAVPTAEGAVAIAMEELDITVHGAEITVVGYGRIGSYLSKILQSLGAKVTITARNIKSRASAEISGVCAVGFENIEAPLSCADIVFNTVPNKVIGENELSFIRPGTAIIDLASLPGGADEKECLKHGVKLIRALGLPGKVAPRAAGKAIFKTVLPIISDWGIKT